MPLYIDYHEVPDDYTLEELREGHKQDLAVSGKYGIKHIQYWFNKKGGTVFCLLDAPDPESCHACHYESCGQTACNLQEVMPLHLKLFMGESLQTDEHDMILTRNGEADFANRTILVGEVRRITPENDRKKSPFSLISPKSKNLMADWIIRCSGRFIEHVVEECVAGIFDSPINAIKCAKKIKEDITKLRNRHRENSEWDIVFRIALINGQPLTREGGFFEVSMNQGKSLCMIAKPNQIVLAAELKELLEMETEASLNTTSLISPRVLTKSEERFVYRLFKFTEDNLHEENFNVNYLCKLIGKSRPQLYRKITSITGKSPHQFITEVRMRKAWQHVKAKKGSISEIAFETGYSNPSHFTRIFRENFGVTPSQLRASVN